MKIKAEKIRYFILVVMVVIFAVLMCGVFGLNERLGFGRFSFTWLIIFAVSLIVLGIGEVILGIKSKDGKLKKTFLILAGASAACIPVFAILHNVVYGLFFHGKEGDEAVFFILALLVCPVLFVIGSLGSFICGVLNKPRMNPL
ncbi:MAG: hypothetical protein A2Y10_13595 [Planctomycetes bacterium GWF2_41_51]|nr:MAG: hypothetical protein A2Y10_13595 [Planctomycetes bacterium GWF2_41_51]HBG27333.1 hypothetical protein [Phycisphaerales bacterium]